MLWLSAQQKLEPWHICILRERPHMCFFFSLIPATFWAIVGYFVLFSSAKAVVSGIKIFGQVLAIWIFVIAAAIPVAAGYVTLAGLCPIEQMFERMHSRHMAQ
jgi:ethanolamine transporter EutH